MLKKLIFILLILLGLSFTYASAEPHKYYGLRCDRMLHFSFGYMTAMPLTMWTDNILTKLGHTEGDYGVVSLGFPIVMGYLKEVHDQKTFNYRKWDTRKPDDPNDAYWDFIAVVMGAVLGRYTTYTF